jgi:hypothetical protein
MRLYITYNTNSFGIEDFILAEDDSFASKIINTKEIVDELVSDGYVYIQNSYILDIDYNGKYAGYHKLFDGFKNVLIRLFREEKLNKLGI